MNSAVFSLLILVRSIGTKKKIVGKKNKSKTKVLKSIRYRKKNYFHYFQEIWLIITNK